MLIFKFDQFSLISSVPSWKFYWPFISSATGLSLKESAEVVRLASTTGISEPQDVLQIIEVSIFEKNCKNQNDFYSYLWYIIFSDRPKCYIKGPYVYYSIIFSSIKLLPCIRWCVLSFTIEWRWHSKHNNILWGHWHIAGRGNTIASHHWNIWHTWHWQNTNVVSLVFMHDNWNLVPFLKMLLIPLFTFMSVDPDIDCSCNCSLRIDVKCEMSHVLLYFCLL